MRLTDAKTGEKLSNIQSIGKEDLVIADRTYGIIGGIEYKGGWGSDVLLRYRTGDWGTKERRSKGFLSGVGSGGLRGGYKLRENRRGGSCLGIIRYRQKLIYRRKLRFTASYYRRRFEKPGLISPYFPLCRQSHPVEPKTKVCA
jgi:hypothetical protein